MSLGWLIVAVVVVLVSALLLPVVHLWHETHRWVVLVILNGESLEAGIELP